MRECCQRALESYFRQYCIENDTRANPALTVVVHRALSTYRELSDIVAKLCEIRVADLKRPASAILIRAPCDKCRENPALCVLGTTLMLSVIRFALLFAQLIERWDYDTHGRFHVRARVPTAEELIAYRQLVIDYHGDEQVALLDVNEMLDAHAQLRPELASELFIGIAVGQLFILAHELAHLGECVFPRPESTLQKARERIDKELDPLDIGPITRRRWTQELLADASAVETLLEAVRLHALATKNAPHAPLFAARSVSLGFALACEALTHVENRILQQGGPRLGTHPPISLRYGLVSETIERLAPAGNEHFPLTRAISHISHAFFTHYYGPARSDETKGTGV